MRALEFPKIDFCDFQALLWAGARVGPVDGPSFR
jgi:hypothetical protein